MSSNRPWTKIDPKPASEQDLDKVGGVGPQDMGQEAGERPEQEKPSKPEQQEGG